MIEIFKTGTQTSNTGVSAEYTADMLKGAAEAYNSKVAADGESAMAPIVVGHPTDAAPAYGWIKSLSFDDASGKLLAEPSQVDASLKQLVSEGKFKKVSASFYTPEAPSNPTPGALGLRHLGVLGAQPPAVKGLKAISFAASDEGVIEFGDFDDEVNASVWRSMRDWILAKFGKEDADQAIPSWAVGALEWDAAQPETPEEAAEDSANYSEGTENKTEGAPTVTTETINHSEAAPAAATVDFAEQEAKLSAKAAELAAREAKLAAAEVENFSEDLIKEGKLLPSQKVAVVSLMAAFTKTGESINFAEGEVKPAAELFREFLSGLPAVVSYSEVAPDSSAAPKAQANFTIAQGYSADAGQLELLGKAQAYQAQHGVDLVTALKNVK